MYERVLALNLFLSCPDISDFWLSNLNMNLKIVYCILQISKTRTGSVITLCVCVCSRNFLCVFYKLLTKQRFLQTTCNDEGDDDSDDDDRFDDKTAVNSCH